MNNYDHINPSHYTNGDLEVWEQMIKLYGVESFINFCQLNSFKYRMRAGLKPGQNVEREIEKAMWYEQKIKELKNDN